MNWIPGAVRRSRDEPVAAPSAVPVSVRFQLQLQQALGAVRQLLQSRRARWLLGGALLMLVVAVFVLRSETASLYSEARERKNPNAARRRNRPPLETPTQTPTISVTVSNSASASSSVTTTPSRTNTPSSTRPPRACVASATPSRGAAPTPTASATIVPCGEHCIIPKKAYGEPLAVKAVGSLADRLRVVLTYLAAARKASKRLVVMWNAEPDCPALFSDLFEPLPSDAQVLFKWSLAPANVVFSHGRPHPDFASLHLGPLLLSTIKPLRQHLTTVEAYRKKLGPSFAAAHLEPPSDDAAAALDDPPNQYAESARDASLLDWACNDPLPLYLACDHIPTANAVTLQLPPARVLSQGVMPYIPGAKPPPRAASVATALIDLWVSSYATRFFSEPDDSFGVTVQWMREARSIVPMPRKPRAVRAASAAAGV
jgi:hypothetical protein